MRSLVPLLFLTGCMPFANEPDANVDTASLEQSLYLGEAALTPCGSRARASGAQNCGTHDQWKTCPRAPRPGVRDYVQVEPSRTP
jgi:hypothetical protein